MIAKDDAMRIEKLIGALEQAKWTQAYHAGQGGDDDDIEGADQGRVNEARFALCQYVTDLLAELAVEKATNEQLSDRVSMGIDHLQKWLRMLRELVESRRKDNERLRAQLADANLARQQLSEGLHNLKVMYDAACEAIPKGPWRPVAEGYSFVDDEVNRRIVVSKKDVYLYFHYETTEEMNTTLADWFNLPDNLAFCCRVPAAPDPPAEIVPPLAEIRMLVFALEAWHQYNTGGDVPSRTELRDLPIVKRWLEMMQP